MAAAARPAPIRVANLPPEMRARSAALAATLEPAAEALPGFIRRIEHVVVPALQRMGARQQQEAGAA